MIKFKNIGNFSRFKSYVTKARNKIKYGKEAGEIADICLEELIKATPKDSGLTAESWYYKIDFEGKTTKITFLNKNVQNGANIALLLEYGHGTATGGWVEGREYIEPVIREKYLEIVNNKWKELTRI